MGYSKVQVSQLINGCHDQILEKSSDIYVRLINPSDKSIYTFLTTETALRIVCYKEITVMISV